jgi:hypothetical protein
MRLKKGIDLIDEVLLQLPGEEGTKAIVILQFLELVVTWLEELPQPLETDVRIRIASQLTVLLDRGLTPTESILEDILPDLRWAYQ